MANKHIEVKLDYGTLYGFSLRSNGIARRHSRRYTNAVARKAKRNVRQNSKARWSGYPRTGRLAASIRDSHVWANQYAHVRRVTAAMDYAIFVHEGTRGNGAGKIYARGAGGRFGGKFPVGKSQGMPRSRRTLVASVRGQRANPFILDAARTEIRRYG